MEPLIVIASLSAIRSASTNPSAVVFRADTKSGLTLHVYSDDTYSLGPTSLSLTPWLRSGPTGFHSNGSWYLVKPSLSPAPSLEGDCTDLLANTDCRGDDIRHFSCNDSAVCCAECQKTNGCGAWTLTGNTMSLKHAGDNASRDTRYSSARSIDPPVWANRCYLKKDCAGRSKYEGHTSGVLGPAPAHVVPLVRIGSTAASGSDPTLGEWRGWTLSYSGASGKVPFVCRFKHFFAADALVFEHSFPGGVRDLNTTCAACLNSSTLTRPSVLSGTEFSAATAPSTAFPSWIAPADPTTKLGFVSWSGRFFGQSGSPSADISVALESTFVGAEGGPVVLYTPPNNPRVEGGLSLVLSPLTNPHGTIMGKPPGGAAGGAVGINSFAIGTQPGFSVSSVAVFSTQGITDAVHRWGSVLLSTAAAPPKLEDPSSTQLTYWTDNGAYYDFYAYEPDITSKGVPQDILVAVAQTFRNGSYLGKPLPVKAFMLDAYWMNNIRSNGNCKINDSFARVPFPRPNSFSKELGGLPLILYNGPQCGNSTYGSKWPLVYSVYYNVGWGRGVISAVEGASSESFYAEMFARLVKDNNMNVFTQDFLDFQSLLFPDWLEDPAGGKQAWQAGQAAAALAANIPVQYCMALPADILASAAYSSVTNARASQDYGASAPHSWKIGGTSLLLSAVGLRASKDNFWSGSRKTDRGRETSPYLSAVVSAMSGGPVGFADELMHANPSVLWPTTTDDGTLLHLSRPATTVDRCFYASTGCGGGEIRAGHAAIDGTRALWYTVLAIEMNNSSRFPTQLHAADLWPRLAPSTQSRLWQWNNSDCIKDGGRADACVINLQPSVEAGIYLKPSPPSPDHVEWSLWSVSPVLSNGYTLLGESAKYVSVSPSRFKRVAAENTPGTAKTGIAVTLIGAPGEKVGLAYVSPDNLVRVRTVAVGGVGEWSGVLV